MYMHIYTCIFRDSFDYFNYFIIIIVMIMIIIIAVVLAKYQIDHDSGSVILCKKIVVWILIYICIYRWCEMCILIYNYLTCGGRRSDQL